MAQMKKELNFLRENVEWKNVKGNIKKEVKKFIENKKDFDRYE